jgi:hypothetical protein
MNIRANLRDVLSALLEEDPPRASNALDHPTGLMKEPPDSGDTRDPYGSGNGHGKHVTGANVSRGNPAHNP